MFQTKTASSGEEAIYFAILESCTIVSDSHKRRVDKIVSGWKQNQPVLFKKFEEISKSSSLQLSMKENYKKLSEKELGDYKARCEKMLSDFEKPPELTDKRLFSPQKTWETFIQSLISGDKEMMLKCLAGRAYKNYADSLSGLSLDQLKGIGESFTAFEMISDTGNYQEALTRRSNGRAGTVSFVQFGENWKIYDM